MSIQELADLDQALNEVSQENGRLRVMLDVEREVQKKLIAERDKWFNETMRLQKLLDAEPVAYVFDLASTIDKSTGEYGGWRENIQVSKPHVPPNSVRNLRPLFAGAPLSG